MPAARCRCPVPVPDRTTGRSAARSDPSTRSIVRVSARTYAVRTYGCQMNEHDSERISGLLEADGLVRAAEGTDADVVVLNTCCIRENADNKLYGHLGHLKSAKDRNPDLEIVVAGCLAQKDREQVRRRAPHVDVVVGTHNVGRTVELLHRSRTDGPVTEILEATADQDRAAFPSALPTRREVPWASWVTIQIGCDNSCAFCIVPSVRGPELSRPFAEIVDEIRSLAADGVTEVTLLGQNVNSYGRDLTLSARRSGADVRVRPLFADLLAAVADVEGIRRVRYTSPHPKDLRDETIAAMASTPVVCDHLHLPLQSRLRPGPRCHAPRLHGRPLPRSARRSACGHRRPGGDDRHHRRVPRRDRGRLRAHPGGRRRGRLRQRLHVRLLAEGRGRRQRSGPATSSQQT